MSQGARSSAVIGLPKCGSSAALARVTGALGNTSCLVGTPEQVARAILEYYKLGIGSVLVRGFDPFNDTVEFGRELIPRIKAGALEIDRLQAVDDQTRSGQFA